MRSEMAIRRRMSKQDGMGDVEVKEGEEEV